MSKEQKIVCVICNRFAGDAYCHFKNIEIYLCPLCMIKLRILLKSKERLLLNNKEIEYLGLIFGTDFPLRLDEIHPDIINSIKKSLQEKTSKTKLELELDLKTIRQIEIIAKAFNRTPEWVIKTSLENEVKWFMDSSVGPGDISAFYDAPELSEKEIQELQKQLTLVEEL